MKLLFITVSRRISRNKEDLESITSHLKKAEEKNKQPKATRGKEMANTRVEIINQAIGGNGENHQKSKVVSLKRSAK